LDVKSGLIKIKVLSKDPDLAVALANAYGEELKVMLNDVAVTEAQRRRKFYEMQVGAAQKSLEDAERKLRSVQRESGIFADQAIAEAGIAAGISLNRQVLEKQMRLEALGRFMTPNSAEYKAQEAELGALRRQLQHIETGGGVKGADKAGGGETLAALRDMKIKQAALEALVIQYGSAKLEEAREGPAVQVVDTAAASKIPAKPKRKIIVLLGTVLAALIGLMTVLRRSDIAVLLGRG
jgi:uncharacterized protein involved in exopolysaccharide biosynthesis